MTIRTRLLVAFAAVALLLGLPLAYGVHRLRAVREIAVTLRDSHAEAYGALGGLRAAIAEYDRHTRSYVIVPDVQFQVGMRGALRSARSQAALLEYAGFTVAAPAGVWLDSLAAVTAVLETLVEAGRTEAATALTRTRILPVLAEIQATLDPIQRAVSQSSADQAAQARDISATATVIATGGALLALLVAAGIVGWTVSGVTEPLRRLKCSMASVAEGGVPDAPPALPYGRRDEIGDLSRSFRGMTEQLAELERIRGEFLNVVSHDLKAPLSLINSYAELIEEDAPKELDPESLRLLGAIRDHVGNLTERINRLLSLGRLEARAYPVRPEPAPVRPFFHGVRRAFEPQARRQEIELVVIVDATAPVMMLADVECLQHEIVDNLLSNAFKFTPKGGRVVMRVWGDDGPAGGLHFSVTDSGPGIPEDEMPHVFSKYYQTRRRSSGVGVGLGLTIAHEVVRAHGGTIAVANAEEGGATFHVTLPVPIPVARSDSASPGRTGEWRWRSPAAAIRPAAEQAE